MIRSSRLPWLWLALWCALVAGAAVGVFRYVQAAYGREAHLVAQSQQTALGVAYSAACKPHWDWAADWQPVGLETDLPRQWDKRTRLPRFLVA